MKPFLYVYKSVCKMLGSTSKSDKVVVYVLLKYVNNCRKIVFLLEQTVTRPYLFSSKSPCIYFQILQNITSVHSNTPERT